MGTLSTANQILSYQNAIFTTATPRPDIIDQGPTDRARKGTVVRQILKKKIRKNLSESVTFSVTHVGIW